MLDLYPVEILREAWPDFSGTKEAICQQIADSQSSDSIASFLNEYLDCCRQHVRVLDHAGKLKTLPQALPWGSAVYRESDGAMLYVVKLSYTLLVVGSSETMTLEFLWPIRFELDSGLLTIKFVTLQKNLASYVEGRYGRMPGTLTEQQIVDHVRLSIPSERLSIVDLHKGVKALWVEDFMDATKVSYRKAESTSTEDMNEELGLKAVYPEIYQDVLSAAMPFALFKTLNGKSPVAVFQVRPEEGRISFGRYTPAKGGTSDVVRAILQRNQ